MTPNEDLGGNAGGDREARQRLSISEVTAARGSGIATIECPLGDDRIFRVSIEGPQELIDGIAPDVAPFLPMAILIAGREGKDIDCRAAADPAYVFGLNVNFAPLAAAAFNQHAPTIFASAGGAQGVPAVTRKARTGLLFSAGVDSFYSLHKMLSLGWRPDCLLNVSAGAHKDSVSQKVRRDNVVAAAAKLGVPLVLVDTNFHELFVEDHTKCHPIRNIAACYALRPWLQVLYYSGAHPYRDLSFADAARHNDISYIEQIESAGMMPRDLQVLYIGGDASRVDKTKAIASEPLARSYLDVCCDAKYQATVAGARPLNCGRCHKCLRTIMTLDHFGCLDAFASRFDLGLYRNNKLLAVGSMAWTGVPLNLEAVALAPLSKFRLRLWLLRRRLRTTPVIGPVLGLGMRILQALRPSGRKRRPRG